MKNDADPPKAPTAPLPSGARNDDSSLFSLESLKLNQAQKPAKGVEDSGMIDLNSLGVIEAGAAPRAPMAVAPVVAPNDIFGGAGGPLLVAPSAASVAAGVPGEDVALKKGKGVIIAVGVVGAIVVAAGVFAATRGGDAPALTPTATAAVTATAAPAATPTVVATPEPTVAAVTPGQRPAATATATAAAAATPVAKTPGPLPVRPKAAPPPKDEPAKPPVDTCDLACQMQRAVQKK